MITMHIEGMYVEQYGDGDDIVLYLHGGPGASCLDFSNQAKKLGEKYRIISLDQYGVLRSDSIPKNEPYGMDAQIVRLEKLRVELGILKWTVIGHSYGGMLTCLYANCCPTSVRATIYDCPSWNFAQSTKSVAKYLYDYFITTSGEAGATLCEEILKKDYLPGRKDALDDMMSILGKVNDAKTRNYLHGISYQQYCESYSTDGITDDMWQKSNLHFEKLVEDGKMFDNFLPLLKENVQPALLLCGKYDPACGMEQLKYFQENAPAGTVRIFENSGHFPRIEEPERYTQAVSEFIDSLD